MIEALFQNQKSYSLQLRKEPLKSRLNSLEKLETFIETHIEDIVVALAKDFSKPRAEVLLTEIYPVLKEIQLVRSKLKKWVKPQKVETPLGLLGSSSYVIPEPRGVCLIISPWNYPFNLCLLPLISSIAAGNCAVLKPSEWTPHTNVILKKIINSAFSENFVAFVEGGVEVTQGLLNLPFDHIFFTGSTQTGKLVMEAASKHLSSLTLELGGKSPTIVDESCDIEDAAEKIAWAKFMNAGQTCVAPDYLLVHEKIYLAFKELLIQKIEIFYGKSAEEIKRSTDFSRIISQKHCERLKNLVQDAKEKGANISYGGECISDIQYMSPTLLEQVPLASKIMQEEIFGPLLPIFPIKDMTEAIEFINARPKPLALYVYTKNSANMQRVLKQTSSGGICQNESILQLTNSALPFGGVGESGLGRYHGKYGFLEFSHEKAFLKQSWMGRLMRITHPPYSHLKIRIIENLIKWRL